MRLAVDFCCDLVFVTIFITPSIRSPTSRSSQTLPIPPPSPLPSLHPFIPPSPHPHPLIHSYHLPTTPDTPDHPRLLSNRGPSVLRSRIFCVRCRSPSQVRWQNCLSTDAPLSSPSGKPAHPSHSFPTPSTPSHPPLPTPTLSHPLSHFTFKLTCLFLRALWLFFVSPP